MMRYYTSFPVSILAALLLVGTGCTSKASNGPAGSVDTTFGGGDGIVITSVSSTTDDVFNGVTTDSNNRIVAVGRSAQATDDILVVRYLSDGTLDSSFDSDGIALIDVSGTADEAFDVAIDGNGKIVVVGKTNNGVNDDWLVMRLTSSGALDATFSGDGIAMLDFAAGDDEAHAVAILASGNIAVVGVGKGSTDDFAVAVYTSAGALDTSFDGDGIGTYDLASGDQDRAFDVAASGTDLILGGFARAGGGGDNFALLRIDSTGARVAGFGSNGQVLTDFNGDTDQGYAIAVTSTYVYLAGSINNGGNNLIGVTRHLLSNGSIDTAWDGDGKLEIDFGGVGSQRAEGIAVQGDGKVVVAGSAEITTGNDDVIIARTTTSGALDTSFDGDGKRVTAPNGTENDRGHAVAAHLGTGFVVAGETHLTSPAQFDPLLIRYNQ
ncbi:MAG: delta-60 repeat domain-containing protein [Planctomycetota bacterium]